MRKPVAKSSVSPRPPFVTVANDPAIRIVCGAMSLALALLILRIASQF